MDYIPITSARKKTKHPWGREVNLIENNLPGLGTLLNRYDFE